MLEGEKDVDRHRLLLHLQRVLAYVEERAVGRRGAAIQGVLARSSVPEGRYDEAVERFRA